MAEIITLITQARTGSTRLPQKVLLTINKKELLKIHLDRLANSKLVSHIVVATTDHINDDVIFDKCNEWGYHVVRGSENDVLDRYHKASLEYPSDYIVRVTSDCPLIDPKLVDQVIQFTIDNKLDYCSNTLIEHYPDGQDIEVFTSDALQKAWENAKLASEREHVTPYIKLNSTFYDKYEFVSANYNSPADYNSIRMTVDEKLDFDLIQTVIENLGITSSWQEYTDYIITNNLQKINNNIIRNEGYLKSVAKDE